MTDHSTRFGIGTILLLSLISTAAVARQGNSAPPKNGPGHIGQFKLTNEGGELFFETSDRTKLQQMEIAGKSVTVTTDNYDITAQKVVLSSDKRTNKVTTGRATGNVRVAVRNDDQNIVVTCETAVYHYATANAPTHIDVQGNVRAVVRNKLFAQDEPLILTGDSGVIELPDRETTRVRLKNPTATGKPIEPETKKPAAKNP